MQETIGNTAKERVTLLKAGISIKTIEKLFLATNDMDISTKPILRTDLEF